MSGETWSPLPSYVIYMLGLCDEILCLIGGIFSGFKTCGQA